MFLRQILAISFLLLLPSFFVFSQDSTLIQKSVMEYSVRYSGDDSSWFNNEDEMIKELAADAVKKPQNIRIKVGYDLAVYRKMGRPGTASLVFVFTDPIVSGDVTFRRFDLSDVLVPDRMAIVPPMGPIVKWQESKIAMQENSPFPGVSSCELPDSAFSIDSVRLKNLILFYSESARDAFFRKISMVNDYYASTALLDTLASDLSLLNQKDPALIPEMFIRLEEINKILYLIKARDLSSNLNLKKFDPEQFEKKYRETEKLSLSYSMSLKEFLDNPEIRIDRKDLDFISGEYVGMLLRYVRWAQFVNARNSSVYKEFLDDFYSRQAFGNDLELISKLAEKMFPAMSHDSLMPVIFRSVETAYLKEAGNLMNREHFAEADELMKSERNFQSALKLEDSSLLLQEYREKASLGVFHSFLYVAENAILSNRLTMAENYMDKAKELAPGQAQKDSLYDRVFSKLLSVRLAGCDTLEANGRFVEALDCYRAFELSYDSSSVQLVRENLKKRMATAYFNLDYSKGMKLLELRNYPQAGQYILNARLQRQAAGLEPDHGLDSLWNALYPYYLVYRMDVANSLVWLNRLRDARNFADSLSEVMQKQGMEKDSVLAPALEQYRKRIRDRECWNLQDSIDVLLVRADRQKEMKNNEKAVSLMEIAKSIAEKNPACRFSTPALEDSIKKYRPAGKLPEIRGVQPGDTEKKSP